MSGWTVESNVIADSEFGILLGGGQQTTIKNNRFLRVEVNIALGVQHSPLYMDDRGMGSVETTMCKACGTAIANGSSCPPNSNYAVVVAACATLRGGNTTFLWRTHASQH